MVGELKMKSEFKNLPSGWKVMRLGKMAEKSILKNRNSLIKLVLSNSAIDGLIAQNEYFDKDIANKENIQDYYVVDIGDFVYNPRISQNAPTGPINRNMLSKGIVSPLYTVFSVQDETLAKFLAYFLKTIIWQNEIKSVANYGARHDRINITDNAFFSLKILLPPLDEQEKIAEILSTWDEAINLTINLIENKKQFKKALMQNLLTAKINWHTTTLGSTGEIITGSTPSTTNEKFWNGEIAWITPTDIGDKKDIFIGERSITQDGLKTIRELPANSLLVTCIASIGKNAILKVKGSCNQQINALIPNKNFNVDFLYYLLEFEKERLKNLAGITATLIISKALFSKFKISFPNIIEQQKIAEVLTACDDEINLLNLKLENLKKQKQGLMQKLLSGKVRTRI